MTTTTETEATTPSSPEPVSFHWIITVQWNNGRQAGTYDGSVDITAGINTRSSVYSDLRKHMGQVVGTDQFVVLFFSLAPNQI
jgi:hypothetical protein